MSAASPEATGGVGGDFEVEVRIAYMAGLLAESVARGASAGVTSRVAFQQAALGSPLDDLFVESLFEAGSALLELQVKHRFTFAPSDREFGPVMEACWKTFSRPGFRVSGNRFGIVIGRFPERVKSHYVRVPTWARTSTSATDFFTRIGTPGLASNEMRAFVDNVRSHLTAFAGETLSDETLCEFFSRFVILDFDFGIEGSRDRLFVQETLRGVVPNRDTAAAEALYGKLAGLARDAGGTAGGYTAQSLRERLLDSPLSPAPSLWRDLEKLQEFSGRTLDAINDSIGGVVLDRGPATTEVLERLDEQRVVVLVGDAGAGKSALLRTAALVRSQDGPVLALSQARLDGIVGWEGLSSRLQLSGSLDQIVSALTGSARPALVIDGADRIVSQGAREAVNDILRAVHRLPSADGTRRWSVVVTTRDETLETVREWIDLPLSREHVYRVPEFGDEEIRAISLRLPHLEAVLGRPEIGAVVRNGYFLSVLERVRGVDSSAALVHGRDVTEGDVHKVWWERIVGGTSAEGRARQEMMLALGRRAIGIRTSGLPGEGMDPHVLQSLEADRVLTRDPATDTYWFAHDIVEDWTLARVLGQHEAEISEYLRTLGEPYWAYRPLQFLACLRLEGRGGLERWTQLLETTEAGRPGVGRWAEAVLTAPFRSARLRELLNLIGPVLLNHDGVRLVTLLRILRTVAVEPLSGGTIDLATADMSSGARASVLLEFALPDWRIWIPTVAWLVPQLGTLPVAVRGEASHVMLAWQRHTAPGMFFRRQIGEKAWEWWRARIGPDGRSVTLIGGAEAYFDRLRDTLVHSADTIPELIPEFLSSLARIGRSDRIDRWLAGNPQPALAQHAATAYADFTLQVLLRERTGRRRGRTGDGWDSFRSSAFLPASHLQGPFLVLLRADEAEGLRVVNALVNAATAAARERQQSSDYRRVEPVSIPFPEDNATFWGDVQIYSWFRPLSDGSYDVKSALMALEVWMEEQIEVGREPEGLFRAVLGASESIATVAVCVAICLAYPERCLSAAVPFVSNPRLWDWDLARYSHDLTHPSSFLSTMSPRPELERMNEQRGHRPQRQRNLRSLMAYFVFGPADDESIRNVLAAVRSFPDDLSHIDPKHRDSEAWVRAHRDHMSDYAPTADRENYRIWRDGESIAIQYVPPLARQERHANLHEETTRANTYYDLLTWAKQSWSARLPADGRTLQEAVQQAQAIEDLDDYARPYDFDAAMRHVRIEAVVAVAAVCAALTPRDPDFGADLKWCRETLLRATRIPRLEGEGQDALLADDPMVWSAHGLFALVEHDGADLEVRIAAFGIARYSNKHIEHAVAAGVQRAWRTDPVLWTNLVARELALAIVGEPQWSIDEEAHERSKGEVAARRNQIHALHESNIRAGRTPQAIGLSAPQGRDRLNTNRVSRALRWIPVEELSGDVQEMGWVLRTTDTALEWTLGVLAVDAAQDHPASHSAVIPAWLSLLGDWLARLSRLLPDHEVDLHVIAPLRTSWPASAGLVTEMMDGYIRWHFAEGHINENSLVQWETITDFVLPAEPVPGGRWRRLHADQEDALMLVVFVRYGYSQLADDWAHASLFVSTLDRWVATVAHRGDAFRALLVFLRGPGHLLPPELIVGWIAAAVSRMDDPEGVWSEQNTGRATAQALADAWARGSTRIRADPSLASRYAALLDRLVGAGVRLAATLREELR